MEDMENIKRVNRGDFVNFIKEVGFEKIAMNEYTLELPPEIEGDPMHVYSLYVFREGSYQGQVLVKDVDGSSFIKTYEDYIRELIEAKRKMMKDNQ